MIYDEHSSILRSINQDTHSYIHLTSLENQLFKQLVSNQNHALTIDYIKNSIWHYNQNAKSSTVETHIYNLKQKLPQGMIVTANDTCILKYKINIE